MGMTASITTMWLWSHLQIVLLILCLIALLSGVRNRYRVTVLLAVTMALLPLGTLDLSGWAFSYIGFLSLTSLFLLLDYAARHLMGMGLVPVRERHLLLGGAAVLGFILYPAALGLGSYDPYDLGLSGIALPVFVGAMAALAWWHARRMIAWFLLFVLWVWLLELGGSQNLWDYLLDPWLVLYAMLESAHRCCGQTVSSPVTKP